MIEHVKHILMVFGAAYIVGYSQISLPLREWLATRTTPFARWLLALVECAACFGFHCGWVLAMLTMPLSWFSAFGYGCFFCATNFLLARLTGLMPRPQSEFIPYERHITADDPPPDDPLDGTRSL